MSSEEVATRESIRKQCDDILSRKNGDKKLHPDVLRGIKQLKLIVGEERKGGGGVHTSAAAILCDVTRLFEVMVSARLQSGMRLVNPCKKCKKGSQTCNKQPTCAELKDRPYKKKEKRPWQQAAIDLPLYCSLWKKHDERAAQLGKIMLLLTVTRHTFQNREQTEKSVKAAICDVNKYDRKEWNKFKQEFIKECDEVRSDPASAGTWSLEIISVILGYISSQDAPLKLLMDDLLFAAFDKNKHKRINLTSHIASTKTSDSAYQDQTNNLLESLVKLKNQLNCSTDLKDYVETLDEITNDIAFITHRARAPAGRLRFLIELVVHIWWILLKPGPKGKTSTYKSSNLGGALAQLKSSGLKEERQQGLQHLVWCTNPAVHSAELEVDYSKSAKLSKLQEALLSKDIKGVVKVIKKLTSSSAGKLKVSEENKNKTKGLKGRKLMEEKKKQKRLENEVEAVLWTRWSMGFNEVLFEFMRVEIEAMIKELQGIMAPAL